MSRITATFANIKSLAFIPYIMAGDPSAQATLEIMHGLCDGGADLLELGIPFSDPTADGITIQQAGLRALKGGTTLKSVLQLCGDFRTTNSTTPIILMGYTNPIMQYGYAQFAIDAAKSGVDGVIIVDLPPEEEAELQPFLQMNNIDFVRLIAPTTTGDRLQKLLKNASGFVYNINVKGITGGLSANDTQLQQRINEIRALTSLPVVAGFGIKTPAQVQALKGIADGVVVGSSLIEAINVAIQSQDANDVAKLRLFVTEFVQKLK